MSTSWRAFLGAPAAHETKAADGDLSSSRGRQHSWTGAAAAVDTAAERDATTAAGTSAGSPPAAQLRTMSESAVAFVRSVDRPFLFYH
jgi:hypothetical protein